MAGLVDAMTGLREGTGLQFQTQIGTANLIIQTSAPTPPTSFFLLEDGSSYLLLEDGVSKLGLEN